MIAFLLPYLPRLIGGAVLAALLAVGVGKYNDHIRKPLQQQITFYEDSLAAQKKQAAALLAQKQAEADAVSRKWQDYNRQTEDQNAKTIADVRAFRNAAAGVQLYEPARRGPGGDGAVPAGEAGPAVIASPAPGATPISPELAADLKSCAIAAWQLKQIADAQFEWINKP